MSTYKAVIFDIDGTLTMDISWTALTRDIGGSVAEHLAIYEEHVGGNIGLDEAKRKLLDLWRATGKATKPHLQQLFAMWPVRPEARPVIKELKTQGLLICLITGSMDLYAKHIADELDVPAYYANATLYFDDDNNLFDFHYDRDQAALKLIHLRAFCQANKLQLNECLVVGDSNNDISLFHETGNGILLDNGSDISQELRSAAWRVIHSLQELPLIAQSNAR